MRRAMKESARGTALLVAPLLLLALAASAWAAPSELQVVVSFFITVTLVVALQMFSGNSGIVSFGHVGFMGVGAYVASLVSIPPAIKSTQVPDLPGFLADVHVGFVPSLLIAVVATALLAAVVGAVLVRMRETAMAMATISVLFVFYNVFENWDQVTRGALGLYGIPRDTTVWSALAVAALAIALALAFRSSNRGLQLRASSADALAAASLGANVPRLRWGAWVLSAAVMGLAGGVWAHFNLAFGPNQFFLVLTLTLMAMVTVGGLQSVSGVVVGAAIITLVTETMRRVEDSVSVPGLTQLAIALAILVILMLRPDGVVGPVELHRRVAALRLRGKGAPR